MKLWGQSLFSSASCSLSPSILINYTQRTLSSLSLLLYNTTYRMQLVATPQEMSSLPSQQEIQVLIKNKITLITSASVSPTRKYILITTEKGFVLVTPASAQFTRFEDTNSPFFKNQYTPHGSALGSVLQSRAEVALMPNFTNKRFRNTAVYIYDYSIRIILSSFDFILPVTQFTLTDRYLVSGNNKRLLLYNYIRGDIKDNEQSYIEGYRSNKSNDYLRYIQLDCHLYQPGKTDLCQCGHYVLTRLTNYLKVFYLKVSLMQNGTVKTLYQYDEASDRSQPFQGIQYWTQQPVFNVTEDGKYLTIAEGGTKIKVFNLVEKCLQSVLYLGRNPRNILNLGVLILPDKSEWVLASREKKEEDEVTIHTFKLGRTSPTDHVESNYKRYFRMYREIIMREGIFSSKDKFMGPQYFTIKQKILSLSLQGQYCQVIDLNRTGLHDRMHIKDYRRLQEIFPLID